MPVQQTLARPVAGPRRATGVRLSGIVHRAFPERALDGEQARRQIGPESFVDGPGAGEALLGLLPELDAVMLASADPDDPAAAGCQVARRCPGAPVRSATRPGPGAAFAALRIADGLCRRGELNRGALFVHEQAARQPGVAVVLRLGTTGEVAITGLEESPAALTPTLALADVLYRNPGIRVLAGEGLAERLVGTPYADRVETVPGCAGVWTCLARVWPVRSRVLLADYQPSGGFHSCVVVPRAGS